MERFEMSKTELEKGKLIAQVVEGFLPRVKAAGILCISVRQIARLCQRYRESGMTGLAHRSRGKPSNRKISDAHRQNVLNLIVEKYTDFGPQLLKEMLEREHEMKFSREWLRVLMIKEGIWKAKSRKGKKIHQSRNRRSREGELIQIDGSYHKWFEDRGPPCCLINMVDDATSKLMELRFVEHESTEAYFETTRSYIAQHGIPSAMYSDRHPIFLGSKNDSQFYRALKELGIELIHANSPQAKGRVERAHGTLQDRLIKLMRNKGISSIEKGNEFLSSFIGEYNQRFAKCPKSPENAHKKPEEQDLNRILCVKESRKVSKDLSISHKNRKYLLDPNKCGRRMIGKTVTVYETRDGVEVEYDFHRYECVSYDDQPYVSTIMDRKKIEAFLDRKQPLSVVARRRRGIMVNF